MASTSSTPVGTPTTQQAGASKPAPTANVPVAPQGAPPFNISPRGEHRSRWLKILIYGRPGAGKTTLGGSAVDIPSMRDVLMVDAESGDMAIHDNPRIHNPDLVDHIRVTNFQQVARIQEYLKSHCVHRDSNNVEKLCMNEAWLRGCSPSDIQEPKRFKTVIIDSITEIDQYCMYGLLGISQDSLLTGKTDDIEVADWGDFRRNNMMGQMLFRAFRDLPMHVIFVALSAWQKDERSAFHYSPAITGKLASQVQGFVDIVGYLVRSQPDDKGLTQTRLYVQPIEKFDAKNRRASFRDSYFDNPDMTSIMKGINLI